MGIRIQPREIDVPMDEPFENALLGRKEPVEVLTRLVGSIEGPYVLAVDAAWGTGKTTFLNIWAQYLHNQRFPVVKFNAWETDFSGNPLVDLSTELTEGLRKCTVRSVGAQEYDFIGPFRWRRVVNGRQPLGRPDQADFLYQSL